MTRYSEIPAIDRLAHSAALADFPEAIRILASRTAADEARQRIKNGEALTAVEIEGMAYQSAGELSRPTLNPAINATGVLLHTGLGRARLALEAASAIHEVAANHSLTEFDRNTGQRGDRQTHVRELLRELTGAEDALVVNNCAAAVFLTLTALCSGGEVVLSRGEMVEIGGSFRMPDIVSASGASLVEVGCTNRTRLSDYEAAVSTSTFAFLRCHPSNFQIIGFQESPNPAELAELAHRCGLLFIDDVGHGCLIDPQTFGLPPHPTLRDALRSGADIVLASGDKVLGGPQAGLILGTRDAISRIKSHPLARAVRVDKLTLAGLEATLRMYREGRAGEIPFWASVARPEAELKHVANRLRRAVGDNALIAKASSEIGGGSMPGVTLPTWRVGLVSEDPVGLLARLRKADPPLIGRIEDDMVWLDPRTMTVDEVKTTERLLRKLDWK